MAAFKASDKAVDLKVDDLEDIIMNDFGEELFVFQSKSEKQVNAKSGDADAHGGRLMKSDSIQEQGKRQYRQPLKYSQNPDDQKTFDPNVRISPDKSDPNWPMAVRRLEASISWLEEASIKFGQVDKDADGYLSRQELSGLVKEGGWADFLNRNFEEFKVAYKDLEYSKRTPFNRGGFYERSSDYRGISKTDLYMHQSELRYIQALRELPTANPRGPNYLWDRDERQAQLEKRINDRSIDSVFKRSTGRPLHEGKPAFKPLF